MFGKNNIDIIFLIVMSYDGKSFSFIIIVGFFVFKCSYVVKYINFVFLLFFKNILYE